MKVKVEYCAPREIEVEIPQMYEEFWKAYIKDEDDRTDREWDLVDNFTIEAMISNITGDDILGHVDIIDY